MIKCPHTLSDLDKMAVVYYNTVSARLDIQAKLLGCPSVELQPVMQYLSNNLQAIMTERPDRLERRIVDIQRLLEAAKTRHYIANPGIGVKKGKNLTPKQIDTRLKKWAHDAISVAFNYNKGNQSFIEIDDRQVAYQHALTLNINTCPYCNENFTNTIYRGKVKTRPQFDHFMDKGRHPYFALSFFNLVPCCSFFNSGALKGSKPFLISTHLHPFIDDIDGLYKFSTDIKSVDYLLGKRGFNLTLKPCKGASNKKRAKKNIGVFGIEERYQCHIELAGEIIAKAHIYTKESLEGIFMSFNIGGKSIFSSTSEVKELVMGNYLHPDKLHKRVLSKLTRDIAEEVWSSL
ncbi:MAG: hypothetical protein P4L51_06000 [Puia sp.]|nr:hypothetical protein [Puia sp.]